jgi:hypothetical protein
MSEQAWETLAQWDNEPEHRHAIARLRQEMEELRKEASEAMWWMEHANEPDDDNQTKEQYRLLIIDRLGQALKEDQ